MRVDRKTVSLCFLGRAGNRVLSDDIENMLVYNLYGGEGNERDRYRYDCYIELTKRLKPVTPVREMARELLERASSPK